MEVTFDLAIACASAPAWPAHLSATGKICQLFAWPWPLSKIYVDGGPRPGAGSVKWGASRGGSWTCRKDPHAGKPIHVHVLPPTWPGRDQEKVIVMTPERPCVCNGATRKVQRHSVPLPSMPKARQNGALRAIMERAPGAAVGCP